MNWLCKLIGHKIRHSGDILFCERCGWAKHNPTTPPAGVKNTDAEIRDGVWSDSNKAPGANIDAAISSRSSHSLANVEGEIQDETGAPSADNQTLYDILANADQGTLTTSGDSIADRIDDYVSNAGVDPAIVRRKAGVQGWAHSLPYTQPDEIGTEVTGGGSVSFTKDGAVTNPGTTTGDVAKVYSLNNPYSDSLDLLRFVGIITPWVTTPYTDDTEVGLTHPNVNNDYGAYLDLTAEEYHAGASTSAATLPAQYSTSVLIIEIDFAAGETRFEQRGSVSETATIADTSAPYNGRVLMNSNGAGDELYTRFMKEMYIGSK